MPRGTHEYQAVSRGRWLVFWPVHPAQFLICGQLVDRVFKAAPVGLDVYNPVLDPARNDRSLFSIVFENKRFADLSLKVIGNQRVGFGHLLEQSRQRLFFLKT